MFALEANHLQFMFLTPQVRVRAGAGTSKQKRAGAGAGWQLWWVGRGDWVATAPEVQQGGFGNEIRLLLLSTLLPPVLPWCRTWQPSSWPSRAASGRGSPSQTPLSTSCRCRRRGRMQGMCEATVTLAHSDRHCFWQAPCPEECSAILFHLPPQSFHCISILVSALPYFKLPAHTLWCRRQRSAPIGHHRDERLRRHIRNLRREPDGGWF